jgi:hypothetical protein
MRKDSEMRDEAGLEHPDIETLADYAGGRLEDDATRRHVEGCPRCRLEARRLVRFERLEADEDLLREANWPEAQRRLDRAFRGNVLPEVLADRSPRPAGHPAKVPVPFWDRWRLRWWAPVAAAVAVLVVIVQIDRTRSPVTPAGDLGPVRGTHVDTPDIILEKPLGHLAGLPAVFEWRPQLKEEYYTIEVFTSDLKKIFEVDRVEGSRWVVSDSLKTLLQEDTVYLWSVAGHKGLERVTVSPNGWFRIDRAER